MWEWLWEWLWQCVGQCVCVRELWEWLCGSGCVFYDACEGLPQRVCVPQPMCGRVRYLRVCGHLSQRSHAGAGAQAATQAAARHRPRRSTCTPCAGRTMTALK